MLATFAFDVCHDVYQAAREVIDTKIPTLSLESSGKYLWHPDRMPRLAEYVADFARAGERALGGSTAGLREERKILLRTAAAGGGPEMRQAEACPTARRVSSKLPATPGSPAQTQPQCIRSRENTCSAAAANPPRRARARPVRSAGNTPSR